MKSLFLALLIASPAVAQSIDPIAFGQRYCELRGMSVDPDAARKAAIEHSYDAARPSSLRQQDVSQAARYIVERRCG